MKTVTNLLPIQEIADLIDAKNGTKNGGATVKPNLERCTSPQEVLEYAKKRNLAIVDFKFTDLLGRWHHFSMPIHHLVEDIFEEGLGFDGSSIRAFQKIHESDMILFPDPGTAIVDPALEIPTLSICLLYTSPSPRDRTRSRMPSSA